ncbi:hypothetical protein HS088_TW04G01019 [Tripterygium wilfordii]|uniref:Secreted protein n=1 Tax=Tripterygium wilfordii TaxID=458696 RepID=A0A7J7DRQ4_TRIWF|nr:hypothetical protein HS088_TW04G01019 [Tripterygium wilfordii]
MILVFFALIFAINSPGCYCIHHSLGVGLTCLFIHSDTLFSSYHTLTNQLMEMEAKMVGASFPLIFAFNAVNMSRSSGVFSFPPRPYSMFSSLCLSKPKKLDQHLHVSESMDEYRYCNPFLCTCQFLHFNLCF